MNVKICMCIFFTDKGLQIRATHIFLQIRTFTDKGPIIITDKAFLHIRASQLLAVIERIDAVAHLVCTSQPCPCDFYGASAHWLAILINYINYLCLSVCPSVRHVSVFDQNGLIYCHSFFTTRYLSHSSEILWVSNIFAKVQWVHPLRGR